LTQSYFGTLKRHGVKLSVALFLGYLFHVAMAYLAAFLLIIFAVFIGSVASLLDAEPSEHGKIVLGAVFFLLLFLAGTLPQSFFTAGAYGAAAACVFRGKSTIGSFFSEGFRNLWKMFGQQVLLVLFLMVALLLVIFPFGLLVRTEEPPHILIFLFLLILAGYLWVSLHAPLFLVVERTGVWNSILLSFRLIMKKTGANPSVGPLRPGHPSGHSFAGRIHTDCPPSPFYEPDGRKRGGRGFGHFGHPVLPPRDSLCLRRRPAGRRPPVQHPPSPRPFSRISSGRGSRRSSARARSIICRPSHQFAVPHTDFPIHRNISRFRRSGGFTFFPKFGTMCS